MAGPTDRGATHRSVLVSLTVNCIETLGLAIAALVTHSVALQAQTATNLADVAVAVFLLIGVVSSTRPPDDSHPVGYGRERFFWSLFAALGIFVGGGGLALGEAVRSAVHPARIDDFALAYTVLAATFALDAFAAQFAIRPLRRQAAARGVPLRTLLLSSTDTGAVTVALSGGCAAIGAVIAAVGLRLSQLTGSATPDTVAGAVIGLMLIATSAVLLRTNRDLLVGRGVPPSTLREMRAVIAGHRGVIDVPDLFAVVVGPSSLVVDGDVTFDDDMDVPAVEESIERAAAALRARWPSIHYIYLTPVARARPRRVAKSGAARRRGRR